MVIGYQSRQGALITERSGRRDRPALHEPNPPTEALTFNVAWQCRRTVEGGWRLARPRRAVSAYCAPARTDGGRLLSPKGKDNESLESRPLDCHMTPNYR